MYCPKRSVFANFNFPDFFSLQVLNASQPFWLIAQTNLNVICKKWFLACVTYCFLSVTATRKAPPRGPGIWKFNNSLLDDELFCAFVTHCIEDLTTCKASFDSVTAWWDFFKTSLKGDILGFAREKRKRLLHERVSLTNRIAKLKRQLVQGFPAVSREIIFFESSLAALTDHALNGIKTRSQAQWLEEGEKPSR